MHFLDGRLTVKTGDLTAEAADALVNAANSGLMGGGGVDGAIHRAGGAELLAACRKLRATAYPKGLPAGEAVATTAGALKARYVIHTVGPVWQGGRSGEEGLLAAAYRNSLHCAEELGLSSVAFPAISTGIYGFPAQRAAQIVSRVARDYFESSAEIQEIRLVFFTRREMTVFLENSGLQ